MSRSDVSTVSVVSDLMPDGTYLTTVQAGEDIALALPGDKATAYARTVLQAAAYADYDEAVYHQMMRSAGRATGKADPALAVSVVRDLRLDRAPLDDTTTAPFAFAPILADSCWQGAVDVMVNGEQIAQWPTKSARQHALHVLEASAVVDLDAAYHRYLTGLINLDDGRARAFVHELRHHRRGHKPPAAKKTRRRRR